MEYDKRLKELIKMSVGVGEKPDYVQAGGGNTSVKFENGLMAVKASGARLKDMTESNGFVVLDGQQMKEYCEERIWSENGNQECIRIAEQTRVQINEEPLARASIEVGFHSVLDTYVLHLHPVYVNVFMCAQGGGEKVLRLSEKYGIPATVVDYTIPGYDLTQKILEAKKKYAEVYGEFPKVYFLKNHGIITTAESRIEVEALMNQVNDSLKTEFGLKDMPTPMIQKCEVGYCSGQTWAKDLVKKDDIVQAIRYQPIYPDQLVYTEDELSMDPAYPKKITVTSKEIYYNAGEKEAMALEETMMALFYIHYYIRELNMIPEVLAVEECAQILGWESEKYRKKIMKQEQNS